VFEYLDDMAGENCDTRDLAGGCWRDGPEHVRASSRASALPDRRVSGAGFRVVRVPADQPPTPRQQFETVMSELKRLNPGFAGRGFPKLTGDRITTLALLDGEPIKDISPVRVLRDLEAFVAWNTKVTDLSPLMGLPLRDLIIGNSWNVRDLSPLQGMRLEQLMVWGFQGDDLSPLQGMPLRTLNCGGGGRKIDLSPLRGMPLNFLCVNNTGVDNLSPLERMPLDELLIVNTRVADLTPLRGMKLRKLCFRESRVANLTPLRGMPLAELTCDFDADRDAELLRSIPALAKINDLPAAEFWKAVGKK